MTKTKVFAFSIFKGGSGKTTTSTAFAGELARRGNKVLMIDTDFQCNASKLFGADTIGYATTFSALNDLFIRKPNYNVKDYIQNTVYKNIDIMPAHKSLGSVIDMAFKELLVNDGKHMKRIINHIRKECDYDYIVIDTPISESSLNLNTYVAADYLIMPIAIGMFDKGAIDDTIFFYEEAKTINEDLKFAGAFINKVDKRKSLTNVFENYLHEIQLNVLDAYVSVDSAVENAQWCGEVITLSDPKAKISQCIRAIVDEIFVNGEIVNTSEAFLDMEVKANG